jgi:SAM-dependent methyltransferase
MYPDDSYYAYRRPGRPPAGIREAVMRAARGYPPKGTGSAALRLAAAALSPWLRRRYYNVPEYRAGGRLLDVGSGAGDYLAVVRGLGWAAIGVEVHEAAAALAREAGLDVVAGDAAEVLSSGAVAGPFDVIRFHHTLEHLLEPKRALRAAAALGRRGARLRVAVPNAGGATARLFGRYWYHWALPFHRTHFTVKTLRGLLRGTGWRPTRVYCVSAPSGFIRTASYWLRYEYGIRTGRSDKFERLVGKLIRPLLFALDFMRLGDNLVVEAART